MNERVIGVRDLGGIIEPGKPKPHYLEPVRERKGLGRWVYCKYCYKNVRPILGGENQVVCPVCGSGLTPDFFVFENLLRFLREPDSSWREICEADRNSLEAREWLRRADARRALK